VTKKYRRHYECPTEFALDVLGGKWKTVILAYLCERPMRYSELRLLLPKLSDKVLSDRLRDVAAAGLVDRRRSTTAHNVEFYALTKRGESLRTVLQGLYAWGNGHAQSFGVDVGSPLERLRENTKLRSGDGASKGRGMRVKAQHAQQR
jgi:DNA-binding HxlR family transcriptional regulator